MRLPAVIGLGMLALRVAGQPHPETGQEYWAIQADPIPGEILAFGRIAKITFVADNLGNPQETRVELGLDRILRGTKTNAAVVIEPGERFRDLTFHRDVTRTFLFHLQPSRKQEGYITYWDGFGFREAEAGDVEVFAGRMKEWEVVVKTRPKAAQRAAMMEWGLKCAANGITLWEGVLAIRDSVHPGDEYRDHAKAMRIVTPGRLKRVLATWQSLRNGSLRDHRVATALMEALAWLTDEPLFHHEVRFWSARLHIEPENWARHFDGFLAECRKQSGLLRKRPGDQR